jgi:hypothetical protein
MRSANLAGLQFIKDPLIRADVDALQDYAIWVETHMSDGMLFDSRAWIITARRVNR